MLISVFLSVNYPISPSIYYTSWHITGKRSWKEDAHFNLKLPGNWMWLLFVWFLLLSVAFDKSGLVNRLQSMKKGQEWKWEARNLVIYFISIIPFQQSPFLLFNGVLFDHCIHATLLMIFFLLLWPMYLCIQGAAKELYRFHILVLSTHYSKWQLIRIFYRSLPIVFHLADGIITRNLSQHRKPIQLVV